MKDMERRRLLPEQFFKYVTQPISREEMNIWVKVHNINVAKVSLFGDYLSSLYNFTRNESFVLLYSLSSSFFLTSGLFCLLFILPLYYLFCPVRFLFDHRPTKNLPKDSHGEFVFNVVRECGAVRGQW